MAADEPQHWTERQFGLLAAVVLTVAALLRFMAINHPFLYQWDEAYHALVASNMARGDFEPVLLRDLPANLDEGHWTNTRIWLHKPPLTMALMAGFIKVLGATEIAVRLPSLLLDVGLVAAMLVVLRGSMGAARALAAGLLWAVAFPMISQVGGFRATDHPDAILTIFLNFAVLLILRMSVHGVTPARAFSAALCWSMAWNTKGFAAAPLLMAAIVTCIWGAIQAARRTDGSQGTRLPFVQYLSEQRRVIIAVLAGLAFALPWTLWSTIAHPDITAAERRLDIERLTTAVEGHDKDIPYNFREVSFSMWRLKGDTTPELLAMALVLGAVVWGFRARRWEGRLLSIWILITFALFTAAQTKMRRYCLPVYPAMIWLFVDAAFSALERLRDARSIRWKSMGAVAIHASGILCLLFAARATVKGIREATKEPIASEYYEYSSLRMVMQAQSGRPRAIIWNARDNLNIAASFYSGQTVVQAFPTAADMEAGAVQGLRQVILVSSKESESELRSRLGVWADQVDWLPVR